MKLAACVVLYHPDKTLIGNIQSYFNDVDFLFIVDNSDVYKAYDFSFLNINKYLYIYNKKNIGIAAALNVAAKKACESGFEWLLTMDQDSRFEDGSLKILKGSLMSIIDSPDNKVGIIAPTLKDANFINNLLNDNPIIEVQVVCTSGNILNLQAWTNTEGFNEKLFIDCVDTDICLRILLHQYKIYIDNNSFLVHSLGSLKAVYFFKRNLWISRHNYIRRYYMTRNRSFIIATYNQAFPEYCRYLFKTQISEFLKIILYEDNKYKKIKSVLWGLFDFLINKFGRYNH